MATAIANSVDSSLPSYEDVISRVLTPRGKMKRYVFRKGVHILLMENGDLYVQGQGTVYHKTRLIKLSNYEKTLLSCNIADYEGIYYYNYNGSPQDTFRLYGIDGSLILKRGNKNCVLL